MRYALIAEPDEAQALVYAAFVKEEGLIPVAVREGTVAATVLFEKGPPVLVITELELPPVSGLELIERLRKSPGCAKTPVVVVSASRELRDAAAGRRVRLDISAILSKAASDESLKRVIKRLVPRAVGAEEKPSPSVPMRHLSRRDLPTPRAAANEAQAPAQAGERDSGAAGEAAPEPAEVRRRLRR